jgi:hypothetical protein
VKYIIGASVLASLLAMPAFAERDKDEKKERRGNSFAQSHHFHKSRRPGDWLRRYHHLPAADQERALTADPEFQKLPEERQQRLLNRLRKFNALPAEDQEKLIERMTKFEEMTPEQRKRWRSLQDRMYQLTDSRRQAVRGSFRRLRERSPDGREEAMNSDSFKKAFDATEQQLIREMLNASDAVEKSSKKSED